MLSHRRHDITDKVWLKLEPHLPGRKGSWGGIAKDNRTFINAVFWVLRTGLLGVICLQIMVIGATCIVDLYDGEIKAYGKN